MKLGPRRVLERKERGTELCASGENGRKRGNLVGHGITTREVPFGDGKKTPQKNISHREGRATLILWSPLRKGRDLNKTARSS